MSAALQELRARLGALENRSTRSTFPFSQLTGGLPRGVLVEITGFGKTEAVAQFLAENPTLRVAWIEQNFSLFPAGFAQRKVDLQQIFFVEGGRESAWAAATVLRSRLFPLLVYHAPYGEERELRRFQLLAEKSACTMLLLGDSPQPHAWPIHLSLELRARKLTVLRRK